jgi:predicted MPP superfamily phosphohydrolase
LSKAYADINDKYYKILMTHNPAHWTESIENSDKNNIALTLSGHTHAMQMEVCGISPARLRYRTWGGLYDDSNNHKLYVNIGIGTVGFPARIGATPEITRITLKR